MGVYHHFQQYFNYIVVVSFIVGGKTKYQKKTSNRGIKLTVLKWW